MNHQRLLPMVMTLTLLGGALLIACNRGSDAATSTATAPTAASTEARDTAASQSNGSTGNSTALSTEAIVRRLRPSVVQVATEGVQFDVFGNQEQQQGIGTGVIIDDEGHIVTNNHVVRVGESVAQRITVTLDGDRAVQARVVGTDPQTDLAVLQIDTANLDPAELGDSASLPVGAEVVAIGYALGLEGDPTVTRGVISAKGRVIQEQDTAINDAIQTDASINPGNSGGPLVDDQGRVVGINTAIYQGAQNIGFSISIDLVKPVVQELIRNGKVSRGFLGIQTQDVTPGIAESLGLPVEEGIAIVAVTGGSPADDAGLQREDVIVKLADTEIQNSGDLLEALRRHRAGESVAVTYYRDGRQATTDITLGERPSSAG